MCVQVSALLIWQIRKGEMEFSELSLREGLYSIRSFFSFPNSDTHRQQVWTKTFRVNGYMLGMWKYRGDYMGFWIPLTGLISVLYIRLQHTIRLEEIYRERERDITSHVLWLLYTTPNDL